MSNTAASVTCAYCGAVSETWTTFCIRCGVPRAGSAGTGNAAPALPVAAQQQVTQQQVVQHAAPAQSAPAQPYPAQSHPVQSYPAQPADGQATFTPSFAGQPAPFSGAVPAAALRTSAVRRGLAPEFGALEPARVGRRLAAFALDALVVAIVAVAVLLMTSSVVLALLSVAELAIGLVVWEANRGKTIGNAILGIRTTQAETPRNSGPARAAVRGLVVFAGSVVAVIGAFVVVASTAWDSTGRSQGWHDKAGRTVTVRLASGRRTTTRDWQQAPARAGTATPEPRRAAGPGAAQGAPLAPRVSAEPQAGQATPAPDAQQATSTSVVSAMPLQPMSSGFTPLSGPVADERAEPTAAEEQRARAIEYISPTVSSTRMMVEELDDDSSPEPDRAPVEAAAPVATAPASDISPVSTTAEQSATRVTSMLFAFDTGAQHRVTVPGTGVIGRNPRAFTEGDQLIAIDDPAKSMSKSHLLFQLSGSAVQVLDNASTNGSEILDDEGTTTALVANQWTTVSPGSRVRVGQRVFAISAVDR